MNIFDNNIFYKNNNDFRILSVLNNISYSLIDNNYIKYIDLNIINYQINNKFIIKNDKNNIKQHETINISNETIKQNTNDITNNINPDISNNNIKQNEIIKNNIIEKNNIYDNNNSNSENNNKNDEIFIVKKVYKKIKKNNDNKSNKIKNNLNNSEENKNQLEIMNKLFEKQINSGIINKPKINGDSLKLDMYNFIDNCIMASILKYDTNQNIYIMDIIKLKNNVMNYNKNNNNIINKNININNINDKNININNINDKKNKNNTDNNNIIFYEQYNKWYEMNYTGVVKIDNSNKMLKMCLEKMKDKTKFRKDISDKKQLRVIKLKFIILNKITDLYYIKYN